MGIGRGGNTGSNPPTSAPSPPPPASSSRPLPGRAGARGARWRWVRAGVGGEPATDQGASAAAPSLRARPTHCRARGEAIEAPVDARGLCWQSKLNRKRLARVPPLPPCDLRQACDFIPDNVLIEWFLQSHFTHKPVNLLFTIPCYKIKLTGLWVNLL